MLMCPNCMETWVPGDRDLMLAISNGSIRCFSCGWPITFRRQSRTGDAEPDTSGDTLPPHELSEPLTVDDMLYETLGYYPATKAR